MYAICCQTDALYCRLRQLPRTSQQQKVLRQLPGSSKHVPNKRTSGGRTRLQSASRKPTRSAKLTRLSARLKKQQPKLRYAINVTRLRQAFPP